MKALQYLDPKIPMAFNEDGVTFVFTKNLTAAQRRAVFDKFTMLAGLEMPAGYYAAPDDGEDNLANRTRRAIKATVDQFHADVLKS